MMRKSVIATMVASSICIGAFANDMESPMMGDASAQRPMLMKHMHKGAMMPSLEKLGLSAEQKKKITDLQIDYQAKMMKERAALQGKASMDPFANLKGTPFSKDAYISRANSMMQAHLADRAELLQKIWNVLTPEQQRTLQSAPQK